VEVWCLAQEHFWWDTHGCGAVHLQVYQGRCSGRWLDDVWVRDSKSAESDGETDLLPRGLRHPESEQILCRFLQF